MKSSLLDQYWQLEKQKLMGDENEKCYTEIYYKSF